MTGRLGMIDLLFLCMTYTPYSLIAMHSIPACTHCTNLTSSLAKATVSGYCMPGLAGQRLLHRPHPHLAIELDRYQCLCFMLWAHRYSLQLLIKECSQDSTSLHSIITLLGVYLWVHDNAGIYMCSTGMYRHGPKSEWS